jgi:1,4-dihydroxy-2-naphthoate polyprenyltransferase
MSCAFLFYCHTFGFIMKTSIAVWLSAFRLRTLPLAFSCIITGSALAYNYLDFSWKIFGLTLITTLFLQILSNLANDYGDTENGADSADRVGPSRTMQLGAISKEAMKGAIITFAALALFSGSVLLYMALERAVVMVFFFSLGIAAIAAAIKYTVGKNPYGYRGLGDVFVFLFFGLVGVEGSFYLHTQTFLIMGLMPATTIGLLSVAVLNLNNMRDHVSDAKAGKNTLVVKMGFQQAKKYHAALIIIAFLSALTFSVLIFIDTAEYLQFVFVPVFIFLFFHLKKVMHTENHAELDAELKKVALSTFAFSLLFALGLIF